MGPALQGAAVIQGGQGRPPLQGRTGTVQNGTAGTACPTHSVPRWERRDTWVPPYGVRRSSKAGGGVRPYKLGMTARRGALGAAGHMGPALRGAAVIQGGQGRPPLQGRTGTAQNGTAGTACPTNRRGAARTAKFRNFFFPLSASAGLRRLYSDDTGRPPVL